MQVSIRAELLPDCAAADMLEPLLLPSVPGGHGLAGLRGEMGLGAPRRLGEMVASFKVFPGQKSTWTREGNSCKRKCKWHLTWVFLWFSAE